MTRVALDSNILIYAELEPESDKGRRAADLILRSARDGVIPVQVLGEYLRFVQRRMPDALAEAVKRAATYRTVFLSPATGDGVLATASELAEHHHLQVWDAIVCVAAAQAGARVLFSEDMQDGRVISGLKVINPFIEANAAAIDALFLD